MSRLLIRPALGSINCVSESVICTSEYAENYEIANRETFLSCFLLLYCIHRQLMRLVHLPTVYPKKYAHGFSFAVLCCGYTLTDFPISNRLTSLALWQSNDCPSASKATLMNIDKYFMWIHYERLHNHNKAKHNKTVCIFLGIYCTFLRLASLVNAQCIAPRVTLRYG